MATLPITHAPVPESTRAGRRARWRGPTASPSAAAIVLLAVAGAVLEGVADALPDAPVAWMLTPLRLLVLAGLVAAVSAVRAGGAGGAGRARPGGPPLTLPGPVSAAVLALLAAAALTCVVTDTGWASWRALLTGAAVAALAGRLFTVDVWAHRAVGLLSWLGLGLAGLTAVTQAASGTATGFCRGAWSGASDVCVSGAFVRVTGTFPNPNLLAAALLLLLPPAAGWVASTHRDPGQRLIGWGVVGLGGVALALTASRAGAFGALVAAAAYLLLRRPSRVRVQLAAAGGAVALLGATGWWVAGGDLGVRGTIWRAAVRIVLDHPLGVGLGRGGAALQATAGVGPAYQHAHNVWLSWFVETGIPGGLAVVALTVALAWGVLRAVRDGSTGARTYGCALAGFAAMSVFDHAANAERIALLLWVSVGAAAGIWARRAAPAPASAPAPVARHTTCVVAHG